MDVEECSHYRPLGRECDNYFAVADENDIGAADISAINIDIAAANTNTHDRETAFVEQVGLETTKDIGVTTIDKIRPLSMFRTTTIIDIAGRR